MALYTQTANKRQKTVRENARSVDSSEFFPGVSHIEYRSDADFEETLCFRYYNANERIHGRTMEEWLRPSLSFHHTFNKGDDKSRPFSVLWPWEDGAHSMESYKRRIKACFEFCMKLGIKYWTLYDFDIAPEGETLEETIRNLNDSADFVVDLQQRSNIKPLWVATDLHSNPRYLNGSTRSPDAQIGFYAGMQLRRGLDLAHKLGSDCFLFREFTDNYPTFFNTDIKMETRNHSQFLKMIADYKERAGYRGQLLIEPDSRRRKSERSLKDKILQKLRNSEVTNTICFLKHHNMERTFYLSVPPDEQLFVGALYGSIGSIDATSNKSINIDEATLLMKFLIEQGGIISGGLNIGVNIRRSSIDIKDFFIGYIRQLDMFARGLRLAAKIISDGYFSKNLQQRYIGFHTGLGSRLTNGEATLEECDDYITKLHGKPAVTSTRNEHWNTVFNNYIDC